MMSDLNLKASIANKVKEMIDLAFEENQLILPLLYGQSYLIQKSDNLKHITMARWLAWTNDSSTKCLMFQASQNSLFYFL